MRAKKHVLHPLTEEQKRFAEINHNLVYQFLHRKNYAIDEYYNVVIIDYIMACQMYLERNDLQEKYDFAVIAYMRMRSAISNYFKSQCRKNNHHKIVIEDLSEEIVRKNINELNTLERIICKEQDAAFTEKLLLLFPGVCGKIAICLIDGYREKEIYRMLKIGRKTYKKETDKIKRVLVNIDEA